MDNIFCNVHLFHVPRSWTSSVQMKSSMTFIRGNKCIENEKDNFKNREVKRLKERALALIHIVKMFFFCSRTKKILYFEFSCFFISLQICKIDDIMLCRPYTPSSIILDASIMSVSIFTASLGHALLTCYPRPSTHS